MIETLLQIIGQFPIYSLFKSFEKILKHNLTDLLVSKKSY